MVQQLRISIVDVIDIVIVISFCYPDIFSSFLTKAKPVSFQDGSFGSLNYNCMQWTRMFLLLLGCCTVVSGPFMGF